MARYLWTQKEDFGPNRRSGHSLAFDSVRNRTILFGGGSASGPLFGDTWLWDGEYWTQLADTGPSPRRDASLCFDSARQSALLFGGASADQIFGDTWSWDGANWTQLADSGPPPRFGHQLVFDSKRNCAFLFAGDSGDGVLNDTWEWDGSAWTQQDDTGPSPRRFHAMAYAFPSSVVILFGGDPGDDTSLGDTWSWNGTSWTRIADFGPPPRLRASMASSDMQVSLFGGVESGILPPAPVAFPDTWIFDGKRWSQRQDMGPGARWGHALAFDASRRQTVLFGGLHLTASDPTPAAGPLGDTWEHLETGAAPSGPSGPPQSPGTPAVQSFTLHPTSGATGATVAATVILAQPVNTTMSVLIGWSVGATAITAASLLATGMIPANTTSAAFQFTVPEHSNPPETGLIIILALNGQTAATANFENLD